MCDLLDHLMWSVPDLLLPKLEHASAAAVVLIYLFQSWVCLFTRSYFSLLAFHP